MRVLRIALLGALSITLSGCGYSLAGKGNFLPDYIAVVAIPTFENRSDQIAIEEIVTFKVVDEFNARGRYKIQPEVAGRSRSPNRKPTVTFQTASFCITTPRIREDTSTPGTTCAGPSTHSASEALRHNARSPKA